MNISCFCRRVLSRGVLPLVLVLVLSSSVPTLGAPSSQGVSPPGSPNRPNVILIMADDMGYAGLSCYGGRHARTPHLDRLAREGMQFTDFHSSGVVCSPTRAGLLTGRYQQRTGIDQVINADARHPAHKLGLQLSEVTFAEVMKKAGYATGIFGKWHLGYDAKYNPTYQGFDVFRGFVSGNIDYQSHLDRMGREDWWANKKRIQEAGYSTHLITQHAVEFITRHKDQPFCLYIAHEAIHSPAQGPKDPPVRGPNRKKNPTPPAVAYRQMTEELDRGVGAIYAKVKKLGLSKRTLIFFFSDNGGTRANRSNSPKLRGQKGTVWEGGHRVPAIAWMPGRIKAGSVRAVPGISIDLMPTMVSLAGGKVPPGHKLDGVDLGPVLFQGKGIVDRPLFWGHVAGNGRKSFAVRSGSWKLVQVGKNTSLYNLKEDLAEEKDLARSQPEQLKRLVGLLEAWKRDVNRGATRQPRK